MNQEDESRLFIGLIMICSDSRSMNMKTRVPKCIYETLSSSLSLPRNNKTVGAVRSTTTPLKLLFKPNKYHLIFCAGHSWELLLHSFGPTASGPSRNISAFHILLLLIQFFSYTSLARPVSKQYEGFIKSSSISLIQEPLGFSTRHRVRWVASTHQRLTPIL